MHAGEANLDDLQWHAFVHANGQACGRALWLEERGTSGDIVPIPTACVSAEAERSLYEASEHGLYAARTLRRETSVDRTVLERKRAGSLYRLLVRTASNAYFPQTMSVISLPEYDEGLGSEGGSAVRPDEDGRDLRRPPRVSGRAPSSTPPSPRSPTRM